MSASNGTDNHRHIGVVAIADAHRFLVGEVDAIEAFDECGDEMPARLLAIGDDVDARAFLIFEDQPNRVALSLGERVAFEQPRRP